jgi:hypothetical protein
MQVKSVRIKSGKHTHSRCGIDRELCVLNGQIISSLLPEQCRLTDVKKLTDDII